MLLPLFTIPGGFLRSRLVLCGFSSATDHDSPALGQSYSADFRGQVQVIARQAAGMDAVLKRHHAFTQQSIAFPSVLLRKENVLAPVAPRQHR